MSPAPYAAAANQLLAPCEKHAAVETVRIRTMQPLRLRPSASEWVATRRPRAATANTTWPAPRRRPVDLSHDAFSVGIRNEVREARIHALEGQIEHPDLAVTVLGNVDLGDALARGFLVVDLFAIDQQDDVSILLNRSRIVCNYLICQPIFVLRHRQIKHHFFACWLDGNHAVPEKIARAGTLQLFVSEPRAIESGHRPRRREVLSRC